MGWIFVFAVVAALAWLAWRALEDDNRPPGAA